MNGVALDIGGSRVRCYRFQDGLVASLKQAWLPDAMPGEDLRLWSKRRVAAIVDFISGLELPSHTIPTACAGRKNAALDSVVESFYGSPLPELGPSVFRACGVRIEPLLDDDVCACWGHLASPNGGLSADSANSIVLTSGTGVAEGLWIDGKLRSKGSYPRLSELGLESGLRASAWRDGPLPVDSLKQLLVARSELALFKRMVLSGRFVELKEGKRWPAKLQVSSELEVLLEVVPLEEAPALGALALSYSLEKGIYK